MSICEESVKVFTASPVLLVLRMGRGVLVPSVKDYVSLEENVLC